MDSFGFLVDTRHSLAFGAFFTTIRAFGRFLWTGGQRERRELEKNGLGSSKWLSKQENWNHAAVKGGRKPELYKDQDSEKYDHLPFLVVFWKKNT